MKFSQPESSSKLIIDVHTHIFPPAVIERRESFFSGEPEFQLLYGQPGAKMATAETLIQSMDENGIDRSVVFGFPWRSARTLDLHNRYVLDASAKFPGRLLPLACVDLFSNRLVKEADDLILAGALGFGELAVYTAGENLDLVLDNLRQIAVLCGQKSLVLLVHANEPFGHQYPGKAPFGLEFYYEMAKSAAGSTLIFAHWGGGLVFFELLKKQGPGTVSNIYYDTAASPFVYKKRIYQIAANSAGVDRILFGSDYPLLSPKRYFSEMKESGLTDSEISMILGENAARIFRI